MKDETQKIKTQIRYTLLFFMAALIISGLTAVPVESELTLALLTLPPDSTLYLLFKKVHSAVYEINDRFPFLFYGYDWLAFAHIMIAMAFIGPFREPVKNIWVIEFGMIACVCILPFALITGGLRGLPIWWRLIDCSFGVIGIIPLWYCHGKIKMLEKLSKPEHLNIIF